MDCKFLFTCILGLVVYISQIIAQEGLEEQYDSLRNYVADCSVRGGCNEFVYLRGSAAEKNNVGTDLTLLSFKFDGFLGKINELAEKILVANSDLVCVQKISSNDACDLYEALQYSYAHFLYVDSGDCPCGMLIASSYPLENVKFNKFQESDRFNEGFFDFTIHDTKASSKHMYMVNLLGLRSNRVPALIFEKILKKMEEDFLNSAKTTPFFLCGYSDCKALPIFPDFQNNFFPELVISTVSINMAEGQCGSLITIKNVESKYIEEPCMMLCGGYAHGEIRADRDYNGNESVKGRAEVSSKSEGGVKYSAGASAEFDRDSRGNCSGKVGADVSVDWEW